VTHSEPLTAKEPTYRGPRTIDPMLSSLDPFGAAPTAGDPFAAPTDTAGSDPFAAPAGTSGTTSAPKAAVAVPPLPPTPVLPGPGGPAGLPWTDPAGNVMWTMVLDTGSLSADTLMRILERAAPEADFTVDQDDDNSLFISAPSDEFKKIEDALRSLPKGMSDLRVTAIVSMAASEAALRSARLKGQPKGPSTSYRPLPPAPYYPPRPSTGYYPSPYFPGYAPSPPRKREPADPEMAKMEQSDANAAKKVAEIVKECKTATGEEQQAEVRYKLKQAVLEHFAVRQAKRELEVTRLEARLEKVRQSITKRSELEDQIVDRHVSQLLGEQDDLAF